MTENTDKLTVTLKADGSAPWIVVHADSREEADSLLQSVYSGGQNLAEHASAASAVLTLAWSEEKKRHATPGAAVQAVANSVGGTVQQEQAAPAAGLQSPPSCKHGERVHRSGQGAKGPWEAYFCPTEKGTIGQCDPLWKDKKTGQFG